MRIFELPKIEIRKPGFKTTESKDFLKEIVSFNKIHFESRKTILEVDFNPKGPDRKPKTVSRFVLALHSAFAEHIPFTLSPEVIMMIISQEVAQYVKDHFMEDSVARLFTKTPGSDSKEKINVRVDHFVYGSPENNWLESMEDFRTQLVERVPSGMLEYLTPKLSVATPETSIAHLVGFMDAAASYYEYGMSTCCGVPAFRLEGVADDWQNLLLSVESMEKVLPGLNMYFSNLKPVLREIRNTVDGNSVDKDFWASIYKINNGSGGPFSNGWFNNFFAHKKVRDYKLDTVSFVIKNETDQFEYDLIDADSYGPNSYNGREGYQKIKRGRFSFSGPKLSNFPTNISSVPFIWNYFGNLIPMQFIAGITAVEMVEGFLTPRLGVTIVET